MNKEKENLSEYVEQLKEKLKENQEIGKKEKDELKKELEEKKNKLKKAEEKLREKQLDLNTSVISGLTGPSGLEPFHSSPTQVECSECGHFYTPSILDSPEQSKCFRCRNK